MRSIVAITIGAPPELVFAVVNDPRRWPALLPHYRAVRPSRGEPPDPVTARYAAVRPLKAGVGLGLPVAWTAVSSSDAVTRQLQFQHVGGATAGMRVRWQIVPTPAGSRVTIEHVFEPSIRQLGRLGGLSSVVGSLYARSVDRLFVRPIATRTLVTFRAICEALVAPSRPGGDLDGADGTETAAVAGTGRPAR